MMAKNSLEEEYFTWMYNLVHPKHGSYKKLLRCMNSIDFNYILPMDGNRAEDGIDLRYQFGYEKGIDQAIIASELDHKPCSVLEMAVALARRCEVEIMWDPDIGDETNRWFWIMIENLGLNEQTDNQFNKEKTEDILYRFLDRKYCKDGRGSLFAIPNCDVDLRNVEIWNQMNWYLEYLGVVA